MPVRVCVVGCGALGGIYASHLARTEGVEVFVYDVSTDCIEAVRRHGLRISGAAEFTVQVEATTHPSDIPPCDFGIIATKSPDTAEAIAQSAHIFGESSAVCSVQNGLGNEELIAQRAKYVIRGSTMTAAHSLAPGHSGLELYGPLNIGPFEPSQIPFELVEEFGDLLRRAGLPCVTLRDARGAQWTKLIFNSAMNALCGLTRLHHEAAVHLVPTADLAEALMREGEAVAAALGVTLGGDPRTMVAEGLAAPVKRYPSMAQDVFAERRTEIDFLNGAIADAGEAAGVPVPINRTLWRLMKGLEHSWTDPR